MTKRVDSDALGPLLKSFGLAGTGAEETILQDAVLDQVIDVAPIVRRGRTLASSGGIFRCILRNNHTGAEQQTSAISPYNVGPTFVMPPYPSPMPEQFDVWLLGATMQRFSGSGSLNAELGINNIAQGWGVDDLGAPLLNINAVMAVAFWNTLISTTNTFGTTQTREPWKDLRIRLPRLGVFPSSPVELVWRTSSTADSVYDCLVLLGVFPIALGQDGVG